MQATSGITGGWGSDLGTCGISPCFSPYESCRPASWRSEPATLGSLVAESPRGACMPMRTRSMPVALLDEDGATRPAPRLSGNTKSLLMMFVLFTSITAAQWVGGVLAHSLALKVGC